jgi:dihydroorotate dehydrogenase electron transfer subunit
MKKHFRETVLENKRIALNTWQITLTCDDAAQRLFRPGQFIHIAIPGANEMLLRRPVSINWMDFDRKRVSVVYSPVGRGTRLLTHVPPQTELDVLMPMGNGFMITPEMKKIWLVGGGIGVAPMRSLFAKFPDREYHAFLGFRNVDFVYQEKEFQQYAHTMVATDDGSYGHAGFCTECLAAELGADRPDVVLSCGPAPFFRALARVVGDVPTQVSMEQHMGCGTGGCSTCVCGIGGEYKRVCMQGPVFELREVDAIWR